MKGISLAVIIAGLLTFAVCLFFYWVSMPLTKKDISFVAGASLLSVYLVKLVWRFWKKRLNHPHQARGTSGTTSMLFLFFLLLICGSQTSCYSHKAAAAAGAVESPAATETTATATPTETARDFLLEKEEPGFGLYSYVLFGGRPNDVEKEKCLETIKVYLTMIEPVQNMTKDFEKTNINVTYFPVTTSPEQNAAADWVLEHYDFARARRFLDKVNPNLRQGPYIISLVQPLSGCTGPIGRHLYQDLSHVPNEVIVYWTKEFMKQAAQKDFWNERIADQWLLKMRTEIAIAAVMIPDIKDSIKEWLSWKE